MKIAAYAAGVFFGLLLTFVIALILSYVNRRLNLIVLLNSVKPMASSPVYKPQYRMCEEEYRRKFGDI